MSQDDLKRAEEIKFTHAPWLNEQRAREIEKFPGSVTPYACGRADGYLQALSEERERTLEENIREIETLRDTVEFLNGIINSKDDEAAKEPKENS
jgi:hypothetical protein